MTRENPNPVAQWEIDKHKAIELYPMDLEKQMDYMMKSRMVHILSSGCKR